MKSIENHHQQKNQFPIFNTYLLIVLILFFIPSVSCDSVGKQKFAGQESITGEDLLHHVRFLASDEMKGRETFTSEQLVAARYIVNEFEKYKLKPFGETQSYYQNFGLKYAEVGSPNKLEINGKIYREGKDFISAALGKANIESQIAFVGYGITTPEYDSYADVDVEGKIVMLFQGKIKRKGKVWGFAPLHEVRVLNAVKHGAVGMIFVRGTSPKDHKMPIPQEGPVLERFHQIAPLAQKLKVGDFGNEDLEKITSFPLVYMNLNAADELFKNKDKTIEEIKKKIDNTRSPNSFPMAQTAKIQTNVSHRVRQTMNVIGIIEGRDSSLKKEAVLIGAHYDHIGVIKEGEKVYNGADDNASGTAALLEIAQAFAKSQRKPKRSLLFVAFTGEEKGVLGSGYYISHPVIPLSQTTAVLNMDMIGRNDPNSIQAVTEEKSRLKTISQKISQKVGIKLEEPTASVNSSTDHFPFLEKGIPVIWYFDGGGDFAHSTSDTWDKLSPEKMEKVARLCFLTAYRLADQE